MSVVPSSWTTASLGEVADAVRGITFPASSKEFSPSPNNVCCLRTTNVQREIDWTDVYFIAREFVKRDEQMLQPGDILMSMANSYELVGKVAVARDVPYPAAFGAFLSAVRPRHVIDGRYLFHLLRTSQVQSELRSGSSQTVNIANISVVSLFAIEIPLAPLAEQKRIADKLDTLLARIDSCRERLDRLPALIKRFRQAVLVSAIAGDLTADWREATNVQDEWLKASVEEVAAVGTGSTPLRSNPSFYAPTGTPWITSAATGRELITDGSEFVTDAAIKAHRLRRYPCGTLLVAMYGEGKTRGQVSELAIDATINQACAAVVVDEAKADRRFVKLMLQAHYLEIRELAEGGNQPNLNLSKIKGFPIPIPSRREQEEIVRRIDKLFSLAARLEFRLTSAQSVANQLTTSTLAKAFRGELIPQDPSDEPAEKLLDRVHARMSSRAPKSPRPRRATVSTT